jgi:hypothetical protein
LEKAGIDTLGRRRSGARVDARANQFETVWAALWRLQMTKPDPFRHFKTSREFVRLALMLCISFLLFLRNVVGLLHERGIDVSLEVVRY